MLVDFAKGNEKFEIKGGVIEGDLVDLETITRLAALPSKEELRAMLAGTLQSPLRSLAGTLSGLLGQLRNAPRTTSRAIGNMNRRPRSGAIGRLNLTGVGRNEAWQQ